MRVSLRSLLMCSAAITLPMSVARAQSVFAPGGLPAVHATLDGNGVDLATGQLRLVTPVASIGAGGTGFSLSFLNGDLLGTSTLDMSVSTTGTSVYVSSGISSDVFSCTSQCTSLSGDGATLTIAVTNGGLGFPASTKTYTYIDGGGVKTTIFQFNAAVQSTKVELPNGVVRTYSYDTSGKRLAYMTESDGYKVDFAYVSNDPNSPGYNIRTGFALTNMVSNVGRTFGVDVSGSDQILTDPLSRRTIFHRDSVGRLTGYRLNGSSSDDVTVSYVDGTATSRVASVTTLAGTTNYSYTDDGTYLTTTASDPTGRSGAARIVKSDKALSRPISDQVAGRTTTFSWDSYGRMTRQTAPETNQVTYQYDSRGNITLTTYTPKTGAPFTSSATYGPASDCASYSARCNKPITITKSVTSTVNSVTGYAWNTDGSLQQVQLPEQTGGVIPTTKYTYTSLPGIGANAGPITVPGKIVNANNVPTTLSYSNPTNFQPTSITSGIAPTGADQTLATVTIDYDYNGDVIATSGPIAGMRTRTYYDALRRVTRVIGPNIGGSGPAKYRATRTLYEPRGYLSQVDQGIVGAQDDPLANFQILQSVAYNNDLAGRQVAVVQMDAGGGAQAVSSTEYDAANRVTCTQVRMSRSTLTAGTGACTQTNGGDAPDRITKNDYDGNGLLQSVTSAVGATDAAGNSIASTITYAYNINGNVRLLTDGNGNQTQYTYDGFDRPQTTTYADTSTETLAYNNDGTVATKTLRGGGQIAYTYDKLGELIQKVVPATAAKPAMTFTYGYNPMGNLTRATNGVADVQLAYDALGRKWHETTAGKTLTASFDAAGRRTTLTWPNDSTVTYAYDLTGAMRTITGPGNTVPFITFTYDDLGRRTQIARAIGVNTNYHYDAASRLDAMQHAFPGANQSVDYAYQYNLAGQITQKVTNNDAYVFAPAPVDTPAVPNALNQLASVNGQALSYDARGNLTADPTSQRALAGYDAENRLVSTSVVVGGVTRPPVLGYDALGRLHTVTGATEATRLLWDGDSLAGEYDTGSGSFTQQYLHGPSGDEPLVLFGGSAQYPVADERGSVVATADGAAQGWRAQSYGPYGETGSSGVTVGRFGYAGQAWLPDAQVYHMRARAYSPGLGRFLHTDPIGVAGGINTYGYVEGDPVNAVDPKGLRPGDSFRSIGGVLRDASKTYYGLGIAEAREFGGFIFRTSPGFTYSAIQGNQGERYVDVGTPPQNAIYTWHLHTFSQISAPSEGDFTYSAVQNIGGYVYGDLGWLYYRRKPDGSERVFLTDLKDQGSDLFRSSIDLDDHRPIATLDGGFSLGRAGLARINVNLSDVISRSISDLSTGSDGFQPFPKYTPRLLNEER